MPSQSLCKPWEHSLSRRQWLGGMAGACAAGGLAGFLSPEALQAMEQRDKQVLFVWIDGGMSQYESWDPKPNTQFGGPFRAIPTTLPGVHFSELLPRTARVAQHLTVVRSMSTQDNSHSAGVPRIQRGDPKNRGVTYPFFGSSVAKLLGPGKSGLPPYVSIKPGSGGFIYQDAGFLGPKYGALAFGDGKPPENLLRPETISEQDDAARNELRKFVNRQYAERRRQENAEAQAFVFEMAAALLRRQELFDATRLNPKDIDRYGTHEFGRHMLQARQMLEAGVRFVKVTSYGWDTHGDNFHGHKSLMPRFDQAFASMIEDLHQRGMLEHVLVIAMSEFGRTPRINGHVGRDHYPEAWSLALAGCGVKRGAVVGKTTDNGVSVDGEGYDIGHMFHTWFQCLGIDSKAVEFDNHGQPLPIAHDDMQAVADVLA
ncbi:MAG: DUF1501 domain-containing protein [Planctomycetaceae bacterium]|nr:DUF1501 domain-containing protein [Planctomycetaceae bacterium]